MKKKKELLVVGILIGIFCVVGASFAVWQVTHIQTGENSLTVGCFKVEFTDQNPIQIGKAYPIEDKVGKTLAPYEFTIANTCNDLAAYQINLEVLNDSTMNEHSYIKAMLDEERPNLLTNNQVVEKTLENANTAYKLKKSFLDANETKSFTLRLWLDKNTPPNEEIMNSVFKSKVTITTNYIDKAPLASGTLRRIYSGISDSMWQYKENINKVIIEDELKPIEGAIGSFDESKNKDGSVISYVVENPKVNEEEETTYTAYLQSNEKLYLSSGNDLFNSFKKLEIIEGVIYLDTSNLISMYGMFHDCSSLISLDISHFNTDQVVDMRYMFSGCTSLVLLNMSNFNTENVTNMNSMFKSCSSLASLDVSHFNTSSVTDMSYMFRDCSGLISFNLNTFNTSNVISMNSMFYECSSLTTLNVSSFNTSNVISMNSMFNGCRSLTTIDVNNFNTKNVTNMSDMFHNCTSFTLLDISRFDTSSVKNMSNMFRNCGSLTTLNLNNFNTINVTDMSNMFYLCRSLTTIDLSNFNTSNVISVNGMFQECSSLTMLDVSNFNTSNVISMNSMFNGCSNLTEILYGETFVYANEANVRYMFSYCPANKPTHESWSGLAL